MVARLTTMALVAVFATSHAFVAVPLQRSHASRSVAPRMLFGGGGKEEGGGNMNMMETIKKAQQARSARRPGPLATPLARAVTGPHILYRPSFAPLGRTRSLRWRPGGRQGEGAAGGAARDGD